MIELYQKIFLISAIFLTVAGCKNTKDEVIDFKYEYYPLEPGHWIEYDVDSIIFSDIALPTVIIDTISYQIREEIASTFYDNEGRETYRIERFRRNSDDDAWIINRVWSLNFETNNLQKVEDDLRFVKLVFPPRRNKKWLGNTFIQTTEELEYLEDWEYKYSEIDEPLSIAGISFDSSLTVLQEADSTLLEKTYSIERYAKNVGLVYKELQVLETQRTDPQGILLPFELKAQRGFIFRHQIRDYKK